MGNIRRFSKALDDVVLGGIIEDAVIVVKDGVVHIKAMDLTETVFAQAIGDLEHEDTKFGVSDIALLAKYVNSIKDLDCTVTINDNVLIIKPKKGAKVKYLLADTDLVTSYDEDWEGKDIIGKEIEGNDYIEPLPLVEDAVDAFLKVQSMLGPNNLYIKVDKRGNVSIHGGKESEHQFDVKIGKVSDVDPFEVKVYGKNLTSVLNVVEFDKEPLMYLAPDAALIIKTNNSSWLIRIVDIDTDE